jgi:hypothetical protein
MVPFLCYLFFSLLFSLLVIRTGFGMWEDVVGCGSLIGLCRQFCIANRRW